MMTDLPTKIIINNVEFSIVQAETKYEYGGISHQYLDGTSSVSPAFIRLDLQLICSIVDMKSQIATMKPEIAEKVRRKFSLEDE